MWNFGNLNHFGEPELLRVEALCGTLGNLSLWAALEGPQAFQDVGEQR